MDYSCRYCAPIRMTMMENGGGKGGKGGEKERGKGKKERGEERFLFQDSVVL
jgi:hypothetical protein